MGIDTSKCEQLYEDGSRFHGQVKNGKFHGRGKMVWSSGESYEGYFAEGLMHGQGKYKHSDGGRYQGQFRGNLREGYGIFTFSNGILYEGGWKEDKPEGTGRVLYPGGEIVNTTFKNGAQDMGGLNGQLDAGSNNNMQQDLLPLPPLPGTGGGLALENFAISRRPPPSLPALPDRGEGSSPALTGSPSRGAGVGALTDSPGQASPGGAADAAARLPMLAPPPPLPGHNSSLSSMSIGTSPLGRKGQPSPLAAAAAGRTIH
mmetsp:Transcript_50046/g.107713  ORF Transcript_50046/g.107713 Transcript_50046/m.107713 type:complete len:260 (-) Transcript_50046:187-966(-)